MGESTVDYEEKIPEKAASSAALEVSVSFGRFENDSLSWERFSTFSPNKYLEEVEKCATLGSVAQKRAYFEAHHKKIAAGKAELIDRERQIGNDTLRSPRDLNSGDLTANSFGINFAYDTSNSQDCKAIEHETDMFSEVSSKHIEEPDGDASVIIECLSSAVTLTRVKEEWDDRLSIPRFDSKVREEDIEEGPKIEPKDSKNRQQNLDDEKGNAMKTKDLNMKSDRPKASPKITAANKEKSTPLVKKKSASPITKATQFSTPRASKPAPTKAQQISTPRVLKATPTKGPLFSSPRVSMPAPTKAPQFSSPRALKPAPTPTVMTTSRSSMKKENGSSIPRKMNQSAGDSKRVSSKSLHLSLIVGDDTLARSDPASLTTTRKSLIMERMGDKDIVKRAFKTFQNNFNQLRSSSEERSSVPKQGSTSGAEHRVSGNMTVYKDTGGSIKVNAMEKKNAKAAPLPFGLKSNEKPQNNKQKGLRNQSHQ